MKRILLSGAVIIAAGALLVLTTGAKNSGSANGTYKIELDNAFGLTSGADFKVAGVKAGTIEGIDLPKACMNGDVPKCHALITVQVSQPGLGSFRSDAFCQSRPQSLIGEYFVECEPGTKGKVLKPGSTIPVTHTQSTIPADLLANIMRMPYRERFTLIINELGAAVAGRSGDLAAALRRAVPAISETDNLLNVLANDSSNIQQLTSNSDAVITALANNTPTIERFIDEANRISIHTANQSAALQGSLQRLPTFLEQLRPSLRQLGATTDANLPVLANLNSAAGEINRLLTDLPGFSRSARPAVKSLGQASVTGKVAVQAAQPTIGHLNQFAKPTPELAQNLAIVGHDLDDRSRAVEPDPRSPHGQGYTGLEALLQYAFNQTLAVNTFGPFGHQLAVDGFVSSMCTPYATPGTISQNLKSFGSRYRSCYSWLGPSQPGVNQTDPSNPSACVPDPGGAPPGGTGPATSACRLNASDNAGSAKTAKAAKDKSTGAPTSSSNSTAAANGTSSTPPSTGSGGGGSTSNPGTGLTQKIGHILGTLGGGSTSPRSSTTSTPAPSSGSGSGNQAQQLLNYLLAP
jgi:virulence factor Mce-like protein